MSDLDLAVLWRYQERVREREAERECAAWEACGGVEMTMHKANAEKSYRLKQTLHVLRAFPDGPTTWDIQSWCGSMAPATDISELRQNGYIIDCEYAGKTATGRKIFRYHLRGKKENPST